MSIKTMAIDPRIENLLSFAKPYSGDGVHFQIAWKCAIRKICRCCTILAVFFFTSFSSQLFAQPLEIIPVNPNGFETVTLRLTSTIDYSPSSVSMVSNRITVTFVAVPTPLITQAQFNIVLGQFPAGSYEVEVVRKTFVTSPQSTSFGLTQFTVAGLTGAPQIQAATFNTFTDLYWNPNESGWGINITVKKGMLFAAWFVYDAAGRAAWLTLQGGGWTTLKCYQGPIIRTTGPALGGILALNSVNFSQVGSGTICFNDDNNSARFTYSVEGIASEKIIYRQPF